MNANLPVGMRKNTPAVAGLKKIGELLDALFRELSRVEFLEDDIMVKKDFEEVGDLAGAAQSSVFGVRDAIAAKGGPNVAKGYQK
ncbi:hypothetical protein ACWDKQ_01425 [Saccharopolyspora sp. NPDC000995]